MTDRIVAEQLLGQVESVTVRQTRFGIEPPLRSILQTWRVVAALDPALVPVGASDGLDAQAETSMIAASMKIDFFKTVPQVPLVRAMTAMMLYQVLRQIDPTPAIPARIAQQIRELTGRLTNPFTQPACSWDKAAAINKG